jgi:hypothetical protein
MGMNGQPLHFLPLGDPHSAWRVVGRGERDRLIIEPDPEAPKMTVADVNLRGRRLQPDEFDQAFGELPLDADR